MKGLIALFGSKRFVTSLAGLLTAIIVQLIPDLNEQFETIADLLSVVIVSLVTGYTVEDVATVYSVNKFNYGAYIPDQTTVDDVNRPAIYLAQQKTDYPGNPNTSKGYSVQDVNHSYGRSEVEKKE